MTGMTSDEQAIEDARQAGFDINLLEGNLALSPDERIRQHESAREFALLLQAATTTHDRTKLTDKTPAGREL